MSNGLTDKQKAFIEEYLRCWNATEAARCAGYEGNDVTLASVGYENLRKPQIAQRVSERLQAKAMSADELLSRLAEQARAEYAKYIRPDGSVNIAGLVKDGKAHLIKCIRETRQGKTIEFYDAQAALALIGKHHALFTDRQEQSGEIVLRVVYGDNGARNLPKDAPPTPG